MDLCSMITSDNQPFHNVQDCRAQIRRFYFHRKISGTGTDIDKGCILKKTGALFIGVDVGSPDMFLQRAVLKKDLLKVGMHFGICDHYPALNINIDFNHRVERRAAGIPEFSQRNGRIDNTHVYFFPCSGRHQASFSMYHLTVSSIPCSKVTEGSQPSSFLILLASMA